MLFTFSYFNKTGDKIDITTNNQYGFALTLEIEDLTDPFASGSCLGNDNAESYTECVDRELSADLLPQLGCIPPWLSPDNQCNAVYKSESDLFKSLSPDGSVHGNYTLPIKYHDQTMVQKKCKRTCLKTKILVEERLKKAGYNPFVDLLFNSDVVFRRKVVAYDMFNFVVDVGSSLGLWLGLSILNITDAILSLASKFNFFK